MKLTKLNKPGRYVNIATINARDSGVIQIPMKRREFTTEEAREIKRLYLGGMTVRELRKRYRSNRVEVLLRAGGVKLVVSSERWKDRDDHDDIVREYLAGQTMDQIMQARGVSHAVVRKVLGSRGVRVKRSGEFVHPKQFSSSQIDKMVCLYTMDRVSMERIADMYSTHYERVRDLLKEREVAAFNVKQPTLFDKDRMASLYTKGWTFRQITGALGYTFHTIERVLRERGIASRGHINVGRRGYTGTYKHHSFRSLMELSYILDNEADHRIESAEHIKIGYRFNDKAHNYLPDFIVDGKAMVEIKPECHWAQPVIKSKCVAARQYCSERGLSFEMIAWPIHKQRIGQLIKDGEVTIVNRDKAAVAAHLGVAL